ncbi:MAG: hypothetical protein LLG01_13905 [Planctomycetaceae bacterium]|nr:hypothetical protein [Planctomycetaceae bacterium]
MRQMNTSIVAGLMIAAIAAVSTPLRAEELNGPYANIKTAPVTVTWQYSNDGGKTFSDKPLQGPPAGLDPRGQNVPVYPYAWKGTFEVADPAKVAGLYVRLFDGEADSRATICNGDLWSASGGWWKDLGFCPTLLDASVKFNGKDMPIAQGPILQFWVPLVGEIKKGANTVELRGNVYTFWQGKPAAALDIKMIAAEPQPTKINNGPVLGDFGEGYFTVACRTQLPADVTVEATPVEPAAAPVKATSAAAVWHRLRVEVPKGTTKLTYTISAKVAGYETKQGPFAVALPSNKEFSFIAFGGLEQQPGGGPLWKQQSKFLLEKVQPQFILNTGNLMEQESWSFQMEEAYSGPGAELLARVPTLISPCNRDNTGIFNELHCTPAADMYAHNWTKVMGPVRFIGIDANTEWAVGNGNHKWLEDVLKAANDKYIVVLSGYPGFASGINSKKLFGGRQVVREVIMPLLGKYKATVVLSSWDPIYERIEPTPDKGVTQIVTGCIGQKHWHKWDSRFGSHPFGPPGGNPRGTIGKVVAPDGREWVGYFLNRHYCQFTVKGDSLQMKAISIGGPAGEVDTRELKEMKVIDEKTFKPRQ